MRGRCRVVQRGVQHAVAIVEDAAPDETRQGRRADPAEQHRRERHRRQLVLVNLRVMDEQRDQQAAQRLPDHGRADGEDDRVLDELPEVGVVPEPPVVVQPDELRARREIRQRETGRAGVDHPEGREDKKRREQNRGRRDRDDIRSLLALPLLHRRRDFGIGRPVDRGRAHGHGSDHHIRFAHRPASVHRHSARSPRPASPHRSPPDRWHSARLRSACETAVRAAAWVMAACGRQHRRGKRLLGPFGDRPGIDSRGQTRILATPARPGSRRELNASMNAQTEIGILRFAVDVPGVARIAERERSVVTRERAPPRCSRHWPDLPRARRRTAWPSRAGCRARHRRKASAWSPAERRRSAPIAARRRGLECSLRRYVQRCSNRAAIDEPLAVRIGQRAAVGIDQGHESRPRSRFRRSRRHRANSGMTSGFDALMARGRLDDLFPRLRLPVDRQPGRLEQILAIEEVVDVESPGDRPQSFAGRSPPNRAGSSYCSQPSQFSR